MFKIKWKIKDTVSISFPFNGFTYYLTLFSEFFSSFPHGTCSLSVSCQYLALDEVYHPLKAALSSSSTLRRPHLWNPKVSNTQRPKKEKASSFWFLFETLCYWQETQPKFFKI